MIKLFVKLFFVVVIFHLIIEVESTACMLGKHSVYKHCDCKLGSAVCNLLHWFSQTVCSPGSHRCWLHGSGIGEHDIPSDAVLARGRNCAFQEDVHVCVSLRVVEALYVSEIKSKLLWNSKIHVHLFKRVSGCKTHFYMLFEH